MNIGLRGLWCNLDFLKLWFGQTISQVGSQITFVALPLTAAVTLTASPVQMGVLGAVQYAPGLLFSLFAGAWVDRLRRKPILIIADLGRALLLGSIPIAYLVGILNFEQLFVVAFVTGTLSVLFDISYQSFLPSLVQNEELVEANTKFQFSFSVAQTGGPALAGLLAQVVTPALAIALDALSYLASALSVGSISKAEIVPPPTTRKNILSEVNEGIRIVFGNELLRAITANIALLNLFVSMFLAVYVLYLTRDLGLAPSILGIVFAVFGPGAIVGAALAKRVSSLFGLGPTILLAILVAGLAVLVAPSIRELSIVTITLLIVAQFIIGLTGPIYNVHMLSLRQAITPSHLLGRVNGTIRIMTTGPLLIGSLLGGLLAQNVGARYTLFSAAAGLILTSVVVFLSPIGRLRELPNPLI